MDKAQRRIIIMHAQFGDAGHCENIRPLRDTLSFASSRVSHFRTARSRTRYMCVYDKRNGILKIESPRLAFYAHALPAYYKSTGGNFIHM